MSGSPPLDDQYLEWLYSLVQPVTNRNPARTYWSLCEYLFKREFEWFIPNDGNRVEDARDLRWTFIETFGFDDDNPDWMALDASILEMLIALSQRAAFESNKDPNFWFSTFLKNLELSRFKDSQFSEKERQVIDEVLTRIVYRTYSKSGRGGMFPLTHAKTDQRKVEIWYQMQAYLIEHSEL